MHTGARINIEIKAETSDGNDYVVMKPIAAIQAAQRDVVPIGLVVQIASGTRVRVIGTGFRAGMIKVRAVDSECVYFVFVEDLTRFAMLHNAATSHPGLFRAL